MRNFVIVVAVMSLVSSACTTHQDGQNGGINILQPTISGEPQPGYKTYLPSTWNPTTSGASEDPTTPPNECDCPKGFLPAVYNGHNWVCVRGYDRVFPVKDSLCNVEH